MKKLAVSVLIIALLGTSMALAPARGTYNGLQVVGVVVNGQELKPDVPAVVMDGRTLLPVRALAEAPWGESRVGRGYLYCEGDSTQGCESGGVAGMAAGA